MSGWKGGRSAWPTKIRGSCTKNSMHLQTHSASLTPANLHTRSNMERGTPWRAANGASTDTVSKKQRGQKVTMTGIRLTIGSQLPLYCRVLIAIYPLSSSLTLAMLVRLLAAAVARMCKLAQLCAAPSARNCHLLTHDKVLSNIRFIRIGKCLLYFALEEWNRDLCLLGSFPQAGGS